MPLMLNNIRILQYIEQRDEPEERERAVMVCESCGEQRSGIDAAPVMIANRQGPANSRSVWLCRDCIQAAHDGRADVAADPAMVHRLIDLDRPG